VRHPCNVADLAHRLILEGEKDEGAEVFLEQLVEVEHAFVEIHFLNSEVCAFCKERARGAGAVERAIAISTLHRRLMQAACAGCFCNLTGPTTPKGSTPSLVAWGIDTELKPMCRFTARLRFGVTRLARDLMGQARFDFENGEGDGLAELLGLALALSPCCNAICRPSTS